nr:unnamed protein product [Spirometra erinaceieuropaei]
MPSSLPQKATGSSTCTCRPDVHITKAVVTIIATATTTTADIVLIAVGGICESVSNGSCKLLESSHYVQKQPTFTSCAECSLSPFRALSAADMAPVGLTVVVWNRYLNGGEDSRGAIACVHTRLR